MTRKHTRARLWFVGAALFAVTTAALAQFGGRGFGRRFGGQFEVPVHNPKYNGQFTFARISYTVGPGGYYYHGIPAWAHGYPTSEENLTKIMDAISDLEPRMDGSEVLAVDDPEFAKFPVAYMTEAGYWVLSDKEAVALRAYLEKGGFVIFDDFRNDYYQGGGGWPNFEANMQRVIPGARWIPLDPATQAVFHSFFDIDSLDIIPQFYDQGRPEITGLFEDNDPHKRLMAVSNFNTDISNYWEYSGEGYRPVAQSNEAFELGVNYVIYGLTH